MPFRHEALLYDGAEDLVGRAVPFVSEALDQDEAVMVALTADKLDAVRSELGDDADRVRFADMAQLGHNPARIIPAWRQFVSAAHADGVAARGIGEPIWAGRSRDELVECQLHESLLNVAFADDGGFHLLCPYDTAALPAEVIGEARCSHPGLVHESVTTPSAHYRGSGGLGSPSEVPLAPPDAVFDVLHFDHRSVSDVRRLVARRATAVGLPQRDVEDFSLAAHEIAANSVRHGGGAGVLRIWAADPALICEVRDRGQIDDPLVGRRTPTSGQIGGWGLWIANQVCDLVQIRTGAEGSVIRLHQRVC
jgi:anti-sigma regulatory factor (Ser/Thr protein kinase)